jgi:hypothetical protein
MLEWHLVRPRELNHWEREREREKERKKGKDIDFFDFWDHCGILETILLEDMFGHVRVKYRDVNSMIRFFTDMYIEAIDSFLHSFIPSFLHSFIHSFRSFNAEVIKCNSSVGFSIHPYRPVDKYMRQPPALSFEVPISRRLISRVWILRKVK